LGGLITAIAKSVRIELNPDYVIPGSEQLNLAAFEQEKFCKVGARRVCHIYPGNRLMPLPNADRTTFLNRANLYTLPGHEELTQPAPPRHFLS